MPDGPFLWFGGEPSDEQMAELEAKRARAQMQLAEFQHGYQRLFEELDADQLDHLKTMLHIVQHTPSSAIAWEGMIVHALKSRFNICISCGVNHDEEFQTPEEEPEHGPPVDTEVDPRTMPLTAPFNIAPEVRATMDEYHLDDQYRQDDSGKFYFVGFKCTGIKGMTSGCGYVYPSIEDRMLKGPEECPGCFQKMGHG